jgi:hypothetical protein
MGNDPGAGPELGQQLGPEPQVHGGQKIQRNDARLVEIGLEDVLFEKLDQMVDTGLGGVLLALLDALRVIPRTARPKALAVTINRRAAVVRRSSRPTPSSVSDDLGLQGARDVSSNLKVQAL